MCGIVGYVGKREALPILMGGLRALEYRGYDSAGLAFHEGCTLRVVKAPGRIDRLAEALDERRWSGVNAGIAHTRWATHGVPNEHNAHPHVDCAGEIAVVHNGIIENYSELKRWLENSGHRFQSETDTEVLAHLIEEYYDGDALTAVRSALAHLHGTYGLAVMTAAAPDEIIVARLGSPLVIGIGEGETLIASDPSALVASTRNVIYLDDGEIARIKGDDVSIQTLASVPVAKTAQTVPWSLADVQKGGFPHFMLKEIFEQPETVRAALRGRLTSDGHINLGIFHEARGAFKDMRKIQVVACGSAYYAGLVGAQYIERLAKIPAAADLASEYRYREPVMNPRGAILAVSQSGETADTLAALRMAKAAGIRTIGIVNAVGSSIAREVDAGIHNHAGPEISVASTKAFVSQLTVSLLFALALGQERGLDPEKVRAIIEELERLPGLIEEVLKLRPYIGEIAETLKDAHDVVYLGRVLHHPIALEAALKLKEVAYIHAEGYAAGEMKHGPIAMLEPGYPVIALAPLDSVFEKMRSNLEEARARGARTIVFTTTGGGVALGRAADVAIELPTVDPLVQPILSVIPLQLLAYETAARRGLDVDKPRNLAKSVTVE